jgi:hypothetical protein
LSLVQKPGQSTNLKSVSGLVGVMLQTQMSKPAATSLPLSER